MDVAYVLAADAVAKDSTTREVSTQVYSGRAQARLWHAAVGHFYERASLWVSLTAKEKVVCFRLWQDDQAALNVTWHFVNGRAFPFSSAHGHSGRWCLIHVETLPLDISLGGADIFPEYPLPSGGKRLFLEANAQRATERHFKPDCKGLQIPLRG